MSVSEWFLLKTGSASRAERRAIAGANDASAAIFTALALRPLASANMPTTSATSPGVVTSSNERRTLPSEG